MQHVLVGIAAALICALPALADTPGGDAIQVDLNASIAQRCGLAPAGPTAISGASLDRAESHRIDFSIDCNTPFAIGVRSEHGALRLAGADGIGGRGEGFSILKSYSVGLDVQTDNGALNGGVCESTQLALAGSCAFYGSSSGQGLSSGQRTAIRRTGSLSIGWTGEEDEVRRAAGVYQDTLTIIVGPRA